MRGGAGRGGVGGQSGGRPGDGLAGVKVWERETVRWWNKEGMRWKNGVDKIERVQARILKGVCTSLGDLSPARPALPPCGATRRLWVIGSGTPCRQRQYNPCQYIVRLAAQGGTRRSALPCCAALRCVQLREGMELLNGGSIKESDEADLQKFVRMFDGQSLAALGPCCGGRSAVVVWEVVPGLPVGRGRGVATCLAY